MDIQERLVAAVLGFFWGAVLGLMVDLALHLVVRGTYSKGFFIVESVEVILGLATLFALAGLFFKTSVATAIGVLMTLVFNHITWRHEGGLLDHVPPWLKWLGFFVFGLLFYWYINE